MEKHSCRLVLLGCLIFPFLATVPALAADVVMGANLVNEPYKQSISEQENTLRVLQAAGAHVVIAYNITGLSDEYWTLYVRAILDQRCDCKRPLMRRRPLRNFHWLLHNDIERDHEGENHRKEVDRQRRDVGCGAVLEAV
jgi:hypothetical protein